MLLCKGLVLCSASLFLILDIYGQKRGQSLTEHAQWCDDSSHVSSVLLHLASRVLLLSVASLHFVAFAGCHCSNDADREVVESVVWRSV